MDYTVLFNNIPFTNVIDVQKKEINLVFEYGKYYDKLFTMIINDSDFKNRQFKLTSTAQWIRKIIIIKNNTEEYTGIIKEIRINSEMETRIVTIAGLIERKEK